jgi:hypothetical protein
MLVTFRTVRTSHGCTKQGGKQIGPV